MGKKNFSSFEELSNTFKKPTRKQKERQLLEELARKGKKKREIKAAPTPVPEETQQEDEAAFFRAMQGVTEMGSSGRQVVRKPEPPKPTPPVDEASELKDILSGKIEFELEYTDEYMHGFVKGLDSKIFRKMKAGVYSIEGSLDLHGCTSEQAYDALLFFIQESYLQGKRNLIVVTGRGKNSPGGQSILKTEIQSWLTRDPLKRKVLAFCTSQPRDGGAGAIYVLLRKTKKEAGKIRFEKHSSTSN